MPLGRARVIIPANPPLYTKMATVLILGAGGNKGLAQLGYLSARALAPKTIVGVSVGAAIGLLYSLHYQPRDIFHLATQLIHKGVLPWHIATHPIASCMDDVVLRTVFQKMLAHRGLDVDMPFHAFPSDWQAMVYCLTCRHTILIKKDRFFNLSTWADDTVHDTQWSVWDVMRSSMSVPVCLAPLIKDGHVFVDGMTSTHSYHLMPEYIQKLVDDGEVPLWLCMATDAPPPPTDTLSFLNGILQAHVVDWMDPEFQRWHKDLRPYMHVIPIPAGVRAMDMSSVESASVQDILFRNGFELGKRYTVEEEEEEEEK